jgi:hypothetical protein
MYSLLTVSMGEMWDIKMCRPSICNGSGLRGCWLGWSWPGGPSPDQEQSRKRHRLMSTGLLSRVDINPRVFGWVKTCLEFPFTVATSWAGHSLEFSICVPIVSVHHQCIDCAVLSALSPHAVRFVMRPIIIASLWNNAKVEVKHSYFQ